MKGENKPQKIQTTSFQRMTNVANTVATWTTISASLGFGAKQGFTNLEMSARGNGEILGESLDYAQNKRM